MRTSALVTVALALAQLGHASTGSAIRVPQDGDLQRALQAARPGDTILLEPGATYLGNFVLPARDAAGDDERPITIRTGFAGADPVAPGMRMSPAQAGGLARLQSPNRGPALRTAPGARFWQIELVAFLPSRVASGDVIALGDASSGQRRPADAPADLALDRLYIHGDPERGQKRAIALNSARTTIRNSYISDIKAIGQDAQAIAGWNGPGGYVIENNFLEAAGENILFGGADPSIPDLVPTDIVIRGNTLSKPLEWKGSRWQVKNLLELKNARVVTIEGNVFERNWQAAQAGYAILFTVRDQGGRCPWCRVEDVTFRDNVVRDVAAVFEITGFDNNHPSRQTNHITIRNNLVDGVDSARWGGNGYVLQMTDRPRDVTIDQNTVVQNASSGVAKIDGVVERFVLTNNVASHGQYGIIGSGRGVGNDSIHALLPGSRISGNVFAGGRASLYPPGNAFPSVETLRSAFMDPHAHDYRLRPRAGWLPAGDGGPPGADFSALPR